jgi:hypothetical protein
MVEDVRAMREAVEVAGAASFNLHAVHLAAEADFDLGDAVDPNDAVARLAQDLAFAGAGLFESYAEGSVVGSASHGLRALGLLRTAVELEAKDFVVFNLSSLPTAAGARTDSDGDGLPDEAEADHGTSAGAADTDGDGITDFVEVLVELSPLSPDFPAACEGLETGGDADFDFLTDCDEALLGTDPSLVDTDGDAMPDRLEVTLGTDYVVADWLADADNDGVPNGDEVRMHTDPRSSDAADHLATQYRYEVEDLGLVARIDVAQPQRLTGVEVRRAAPGTSAGLGWLCHGVEQAPECAAGAPWLCWIDPGERNEAGGSLSCHACAPGDPAAVGRRVCVDGSGTFELPSPGDGAEVDDGTGTVITISRSLAVEATIEALPPRATNEQILVSRDERHCLSFVVRNVRLAGTGPTDDVAEAGWNHIALYFAQAPRGRLAVPGLFRLATIPVRFLPPDRREPADAELLVFDDEFVRAGVLP